MSKKAKRKLSAAEKAEKQRRKAQWMTIFINGKMRRVRRPPEVDGIPLDEFIAQNADPIFLLQNEMWEQLYARECAANADVESDAQDQEPAMFWDAFDNTPQKHETAIQLDEEVPPCFPILR